MQVNFTYFNFYFFSHLWDKVLRRLAKNDPSVFLGICLFWSKPKQIITIIIMMAYFPFPPLFANLFLLGSCIGRSWEQKKQKRLWTFKLCNMSCLFTICMSFLLAYCSSLKWESAPSLLTRDREKDPLSPKLATFSI